MTTPSTSHTDVAPILPTDLVGAEEAARILRVSKWAIYQWIGRGYIPHYRLGRLIRIREADLAARLELERRRGSLPWPSVDQA